MTTALPPDTHEDGVLEFDLAEQLPALEAALTELPLSRATAVLLAEVPQYGESLIVAYVPVDAEREASALRAVRAVCARIVPALPALVVPVDGIPCTLEGEVRAQALFDSLLPQIARDLLLPSEMSA
ncbi:hypothetical protein ACIQGZ_26145 [Streptomyces sp. NPDC092296]|uniref:hypothetical protein n=1 Tax=Streptomyces sp. NPDC092296 TaxID=3366012 RepID=UPI003813BB14